MSHRQVFDCAPLSCVLLRYHDQLSQVDVQTETRGKGAFALTNFPAAIPVNRTGAYTGIHREEHTLRITFPKYIQESQSL